MFRTANKIWNLLSLCLGYSENIATKYATCLIEEYHIDNTININVLFLGFSLNFVYAYGSSSREVPLLSGYVYQSFRFSGKDIQEISRTQK